MTTATASRLEEICRTGIPGYDPWAALGDCTFDEEAAAEAVRFIETYCRHVKGALAGKPFILEQWEVAIVANLFGWKRPDGTRRYREAFIFLPRKNGKTTLAAAIVCRVMYADAEPGAELYSAAADRDQAMLVFSQVEGMVRQEPEFDSVSRIYTAAKSVVVGTSSYKAISAEAGTKHGFNSHLVIVDELHAQPKRDLVDVLLTSTGSRTQPLVIHITTSDYARESICNEKHDYACRVRDGVIDDPSFLPVIYEAGVGEDWTDPKVWAAANPNLGVSLSEEYLQRECQRAQEVPAFENTFKRLHLNVCTEQDVRWMPMDAWRACSDEADPAAWLERQREALKGCQCWGGLDLASTRDVASFKLWFPEQLKVLPWFFVPADNAHDRERRDKVPYATWGRQGFVTLTPGNVIDYAAIEAQIKECGELYNIVDIGADRWNLEYLRQRLTDVGADIVPFGQGMQSMSAPMKELLKLVLAGDLDHGGHPVLEWMAGNVVAEIDAAENVKPNKKKSSEKIDGIVALIMALGRWMACDTEGGSVYDTRGLVTV